MIDITGVIYDGMWDYEPPFPNINIKPLPEVPWVENKVYCEIFDGLHSQTGTYLETPAHFLGDKSYPLIDVSIERIHDVDAVVLKLSGFEAGKGRQPITAEMLQACSQASLIKPGDALLVSCDWGRYWREPFYLSESPYFTLDAMRWLIGKKPGILGSDTPRWENLDDLQGFFPEFYDADILMLAPCVNLEKAEERKMKLSALPIKVEKTSCAPCRAVLY